MKQNNDPLVKRFAFIGFGLIISLYVFFGVFSWININSFGELIFKIYQHPLEVSNAALQASRNIVKIHRNMKDVVLAENPDQIEHFINEVNKEEKIVIQNLDLIQKKILGSEGRELEEETRKLFTNWKPIRAKVIDQIKSGNIVTAARITKGKGADHELLLEQKMSDLTRYARKKADGFFNMSKRLHQKTVYLTGFVVGLGAILSLITAFFTVKKITSAFEQQMTAERYLGESEKKFKDFMMSATAGFVLYDSKLNMVAINDKALEIFPAGTKREALLGLNILDISPGLKETDRYNKYLAVMKTGEPLYLADITPNPIFGDRHLSVRAFRVGTGLGFTFTDVTELLRSRKALQQANDIINRSPAVAFQWKNADGWPVEFVSDNVLKLLGYSKEDFISGKVSYLDIIHPNDQEQVSNEVIRYSEEKERSSFRHKPYRITTKDGEEKWIADNTYIVRNKNQEITHYEGIIYDITDRLQSGEGLRKLSQAVEQSGSTIVVTDINATIEYVNPAFSTITGYTSEEAVGQNPRILKSGHHSPQFYKELWNTLTNGDIWKGEIINKKKSGELFWEFAAISPITNPSGKVTHYVAIKEDISKRKVMENELLEAKKIAESANRTKSQFLANMSHELRTPLNSIIGFSQVLETQIFKNLSEKQRSYFNNIKEGGNHLLEMVNDILDLSKIEAGKIEIERKPYDFGAMLKRSPSIIQENAHSKKLQIEIAIQNDLGWINGDETKLKQVMYNLFSNAVKFTEPGKSIGIDATAEGDIFYITVWDEGPGIPDNYFEKIFDPFEQIKGDNTSPEKGTGLGLAISRKLIELHHGSITVKSTMGKGSRFTITLPGRIINEEQDIEDIAIRKIEQAGNLRKEIRILVTDDNEANRELIKAALDDYQLEFAVNGEDSVTMALAKNYDLILMDIQLPGIDGVETMKQIRRNSKKYTPMIALTAFAMKGDEETYLGEGFDNYISKPIDISLMIEKIERILV